MTDNLKNWLYEVGAVSSEEDLAKTIELCDNKDYAMFFNCNGGEFFVGAKSEIESTMEEWFYDLLDNSCSCFSIFDIVNDKEASVKLRIQ